MAKKLSKNLTPEELKEQRLKDLDAQKRRILREYAFQNINSLPDLYKHMGAELPKGDVYPYLDMPINKDVIIDWFSSRKESIEKGETENEQQVTGIIVPEIELPKEVQEDIPKLPSLFNNPNVKWQPFQNKAAYRLIKAIQIHKRKGLLLQAPVGVGKTFILGAVIRELIDNKWEPIQEGVCFSPYPIVYITKATIVEQTMRVLEDKFGLIIGTDVDVTNIDQLRSKFGAKFIEEKTIVRYNEAHIEYIWRPKFAPRLMIWDECQTLKNEDSDQSKRAQAYNNLDGEYYQIFSSATPFTRVCEAKCFAVSTKLQYT